VKGTYSEETLSTEGNPSDRNLIEGNMWEENISEVNPIERNLSTEREPYVIET